MKKIAYLKKERTYSMPQVHFDANVKISMTNYDVVFVIIITNFEVF